MPDEPATTPGRPLRICQIVPALDGGGVERGTLEVARAIVARGHESTVVSAGGRLSERLVAEGSEHIDWPVGRKSLRTLRLVGPLRRLMIERAFDIVHLRSRLPAWIAWLAWRRLPTTGRPRLVTTVHGLYSVSAYSAIMTRGERVVATSETVRRYLAEHYPSLPPERIVVIPRGIDPSEFPPGFRPSPEWRTRWFEDWPMLRDRPVVLLPGRLSRLKGHHDLLELMTRLKRDGSPIQAIVVGGHGRRGYTDELRRAVSSRGLDNLHFLGPRSDIREIYASVDCVLSLSRRPESFGRTVIEALSIGTPVVGYDHGGVGEVLGRAFPEGRIPLGDIDALKRKVTTFIDRRPRVPPPPYTLDTMLERTIRLYEALCR